MVPMSYIKRENVSILLGNKVQLYYFSYHKLLSFKEYFLLHIITS